MKHNKRKEIEIRNIFLVLKKRIWIIILITALCTAVGYLYSEKKYPNPLYEVTGRVIIDDQYGLMSTLIVFFKEPAVVDKVIKDLNLEMEMNDLRNQIAVTNVDDSQILKVSITHPNYETAAKILNKLIVVYKDLVAEILNFNGVEILSEAPLGENSPSLKAMNPGNRLIIISFVIGLISSIGYVFLLDSLDYKIRSEREIELLLEVPVIGSISTLKKKKKKKGTGNHIAIVKGDLFDGKKEKHTFI